MRKIIILLVIPTFAGCEGFLDEDIRSTHNYENYFQSEDDLVRFSNGMFGGLIIWTWEQGGLFFNNYWVLQDLASDNCFETGPSVDMHDLSKFTFDPNNIVFDFIWQGCYFLINSANVLLVESENIADYSGTTLYTASRTLSAWEKRGWIKSGREKNHCCGSSCPGYIRRRERIALPALSKITDWIPHSIIFKKSGLFAPAQRHRLLP